MLSKAIPYPPYPRRSKCSPICKTNAKPPAKAWFFDDNDDGFSQCPEFAFIQINPKTGLTPGDIEKGVFVLNDRQA